MLWIRTREPTRVEASLSLLRAFVGGGGRRAVFAGACAEYDWTSLAGIAGQTSAVPRCVEDRTPLRPATLYGTAKHATRLVSEAYAEQAGLEFAWGRIFFPGGRPGPSCRVGGATSLLSGAPVPTTAGGQIRDFMEVGDVARTFVSLLASDGRGAFNVASGRGVTVREVVERVAALTGRPELVQRGALPSAEGDPPALVADVARLREEIGFTPRVDLPAGLERTVSWWREHARG